MIANVHRDPKQRAQAFTAEELHPYRAPPRQPASEADIDVLQVFLSPEARAQLQHGPAVL